MKTLGSIIVEKLEKEMKLWEWENAKIALQKIDIDEGKIREIIDNNIIEYKDFGELSISKGLAEAIKDGIGGCLR